MFVAKHAAQVQASSVGAPCDLRLSRFDPSSVGAKSYLSCRSGACLVFRSGRYYKHGAANGAFPVRATENDACKVQTLVGALLSQGG